MRFGGRVGLQHFQRGEQLKCRAATYFLGVLLILVLSCSSNEDELSPPGSITSSTIGEVCEAIREGFEESPLASFMAIGDCEEQTTPSGGRSLWVEMSDLSLAYPDFRVDELEEAMVDAAVINTAYGLRVTKTSPLEFEQLFYSFRDSRGSYFEINPSDMTAFVPESDISQTEWNETIEREIKYLYPKVAVQTTK